jgi:nucleotide-binding universal stress UspA family protein
MQAVSNELPAIAGEIYSPREDYVPVNPATYQFPRAIGLPRPRENVFPEEVIREVTQRLRENGQIILTESASLFSAEGFEVKQKLVEAVDTAEAIIDEAEAGTYDLIIIGNSGGEENESDLHLGSVARKVSLSVKTPIIINRGKKEVKKILIPVDGSREEERAIEKAVMIAKAAKSQILLLHVQEKALLKLKPEINKVGVKILNHASTMLQGTTFEQTLASGDPAKTIIETAKSAGIDLIVMRGGTLGSLKRAFLGSVSDHVIQHATVPVLLVK